METWLFVALQILVCIACVGIVTASGVRAARARHALKHQHFNDVSIHADALGIRIAPESSPGFFCGSTTVAGVPVGIEPWSTEEIRTRHNRRPYTVDVPRSRVFVPIPCRWTNAAIVQERVPIFGMGHLAELSFPVGYPRRVFAAQPSNIHRWLMADTCEALARGIDLESLTVQDGALSMVVRSPFMEAEDMFNAAGILSAVFRGAPPPPLVRSRGVQRESIYEPIWAFVVAISCAAVLGPVAALLTQVDGLELVTLATLLGTASFLMVHGGTLLLRRRRRASC